MTLGGNGQLACVERDWETPVIGKLQDGIRVWHDSPDPDHKCQSQVARQQEQRRKCRCTQQSRWGDPADYPGPLVLRYQQLLPGCTAGPEVDVLTDGQSPQDVAGTGFHQFCAHYSRQHQYGIVALRAIAALRHYRSHFSRWRSLKPSCWLRRWQAASVR